MRSKRLIITSETRPSARKGAIGSRKSPSVCSKILAEIMARSGSFLLGQRVVAQVLLEPHAHRMVLVGYDGDDLRDRLAQRLGVVGAQIARQPELQVVVDLLGRGGGDAQIVAHRFEPGDALPREPLELGGPIE